MRFRVTRVKTGQPDANLLYCGLLYWWSWRCRYSFNGHLLTKQFGSQVFRDSLREPSGPSANMKTIEFAGYVLVRTIFVVRQHIPSTIAV